MNRLTKREGEHTIRIGNEWRRHDPVWDKLAHYEDLIEQNELVYADRLIMAVVDWQRMLNVKELDLDILIYNTLEGVIDMIADFDNEKFEEINEENNDCKCKNCIIDAPYTFCCKIECGEHEFCKGCDIIQ